MGSFQRRLWSTIALAIGLLLILTGLSAPAQAITTRTITLAASPTAQVAGAKFLFYGHLSHTPTGSTVKLERKLGGSWVSVTSTKTLNSTGYYGANVIAPSTAGSYYFRARAGASSRYSAATSKTVTVTVLRKVGVAIKATPSTISKAQPVVLSGAVKPFVSGDVGFIQRFNGAKWIDLTTATITKTGTFSRTLTTSVTTTYRFYVPRHGLNAAGYSGSAKVTFPTGPQSPTIDTTSMPDGFTDTFYSKTLQKTGEAGTWAITSGSLPPGLTLGSSSGTVSGTPTAGGTYNFTVTFSQTGNFLHASRALSIKVLVKPRITTTELPDATAYSSYSTPLTKTGQAGTWSVSSGSLPSGVSLDATTGVISGKPTVAGSYPLVFKYTETTSGLFVTKSLPLTVRPAPDPVITSSSPLKDATAYVNYSVTLTKTGNAGTWSLIDGSLPTGLSLDPATGVISGKPTGATVSGDYAVTVKFTETESGTFATKTLALHVNPPPKPTITSSSPLPGGQAFKTYTTTLTVTGNPGTWSSTALPTGLSLDPSTGVLSGKPTVSGDFSITFTFTETESGAFGTKVLSLHLDKAPDPLITTTTVPNVLINTSYSAQLSKTGNPGSWSISGGNLPAGLTLDAGTGLISGTPTVAGTYSFNVKFTETESGTFDTQVLTIVVYSRPTITTVGLPDALKGNAYSASLTKSGGSGSGSWSVSAGTLPTGITLSSAGVFSGTPTVDGDYTFTVQFLDTVTGASTTKQLSIHVGPTAIRNGSLPDGKVGVAYSVQLDGAPSGISGWAIQSGSLPPGLSLNTGSGLISGTPTTAGDYTVSFTYSVLLKPSRTRTYTLHINP